MLQLVYISTATIPLTHAVVEEICEKARENNRRDEITGLLVAKDGKFLQVLEGPKDTVEDTFLRIVVDPRHCDLTLLSRRSTTRRYFGAWDMRHCYSIERCGNAIALIEPLIADAPDPVHRIFADFIA